MIAFYCCLPCNNMLRGICISKNVKVAVEKWKQVSLAFIKLVQVYRGIWYKAGTVSFRYLLGLVGFCFFWSCSIMNCLVLFEKFSFWFWGLGTELLKFCHIVWQNCNKSSMGSSVQNVYQQLLLMESSPLTTENCLFFLSPLTMNSTNLWKGIEIWAYKSSKDYSSVPSEKFEVIFALWGKYKSHLCCSEVLCPLKLGLTPQLFSASS